MEKKQMEREMFAVARERLQRHGPAQIARDAVIRYDGRSFELPTLGDRIHIAYPECVPDVPMEHWHLLTILHSLDLADGAPLAGTYKPFAAMKDGMVRGGGFDQDAQRRLAEMLRGRGAEDLRAACEAMGGQIVPSRADLSAILSFLPKVPLLLNVWFEDDEFPTSGKLMPDANADHYLTIEDAVTVGDVVLSRLQRAMR